MKERLDIVAKNVELLKPFIKDNQVSKKDLEKIEVIVAISHLQNAMTHGIITSMELKELLQ